MNYLCGLYICSMNHIPFHIAYLLTHHECVIIPGLGAFVVSPTERETTSRWGILPPPENFLGFNSEIKHNDGLLANSIAKATKNTYKEATSLIEQYVSDVLQRLDKGEGVNIPWVGSLYLNNNRKLFQPGKTLSCNAFNYGLTGFSLPYLSDIQQKAPVFPEKKNKEVVWIPICRKFLAYTGSIAAAVLIMCIIPTPLNNGRLHSAHTQYASLISLPAQETPAEVNDAPTVAIEMPASSSSEEIETTNPAKTATSRYYIIVASLPNQLSADKALTDFQSKGFDNAAVLSSDDRHRIYTDCFEDKAEAEKFLIQFRKNHPAQANAWLLKQKD